jgi:hypothetical protein
LLGAFAFIWTGFYLFLFLSPPKVEMVLETCPLDLAKCNVTEFFKLEPPKFSESNPISQNFESFERLEAMIRAFMTETLAQ